MSEAAVSTGAESTESAPQTSAEAPSVDNTEVSGQSATPDTKNEPMYEIKVDGTVLRMTLEEMKRHAQMGTASTKRFQEAAQAKKEAERLYAKLKENPIQAAREAGVSPEALRELMEKHLYDLIKYDEMSPEEKEREELRKYKAETEKEKAQQKDQENAQRHQQEIIHHQNNYIASYDKAFTLAGLPKSEAAIQRVAQIQLEALESDWDMPVEMAVDQYKQEQSNGLKNYLGGLSAEQLEQVLGKDKLKELRKKEIAELKNPISSGASTKSQTRPVKREKLNASKFFDSLK